MNFQEIARRKVVGVPLIYWGLAAVTVLGFVAWKLKPASTGDTPDSTAQDGTDSTQGGDLSSLNTTGTVVVQPQAAPTTPAVEETNETWLRAAVNYLVNDAKLATVGDAQRALSKYLNGEDLSFDEGKLRDAAVQKLKLPPEPLGKIGQTASAPAQRQFTNLPGKHTVKGSNDNTAAKLAQLYYGTSDANHVNKLMEYNTKLGGVNATLGVGTVVEIPVYYNPRYYKVTGKNGDNYFEVLARRYSLSTLQLLALNPNLTQPIPTGTSVRYI